MLMIDDAPEKVIPVPLISHTEFQNPEFKSVNSELPKVSDLVLLFAERNFPIITFWLLVFNEPLFK